MIVSCPSCIARYKVNEAKIKGRGAKITCPRCGHVFVVYKDQASTPTVEDTSGSEDTSRRDFREVGVTWRVRKVSGATLEVSDLATLRDQIDEGEVGYRDSLSYDGGRTWIALDSIASLDALFDEIWERGSMGLIDSTPPPAGGGDEDDDEDDAPTTIVDREVSLADAIRKAVKAATPSTPPPRDDLHADFSTQPTKPVPPPPSPIPAPAPAPAPPLVVEKESGSSAAVWIGAGLVVLLLLVALALVGLGVVDVPGMTADEEPVTEEPADEDADEPEVPATEEPAAPEEPPPTAPEGDGTETSG